MIHATSPGEVLPQSQLPIALHPAGRERKRWLMPPFPNAPAGAALLPLLPGGAGAGEGLTFLALPSVSSEPRSISILWWSYG
jgi:hypothetical protein